MFWIDLQVLRRGVLALPEIERADLELRAGFSERDVGRERTRDGGVVKDDFHGASDCHSWTLGGLRLAAVAHHTVAVGLSHTCVLSLSWKVSGLRPPQIRLLATSRQSGIAGRRRAHRWFAEFVRCGRARVACRGGKLAAPLNGAVE